MSTRIHRRMSLDGTAWKFEKIRPGGGVAEGFPTIASEYQGTLFSWPSATVPGDIYTDLQRSGELPDLLMGRNVNRAKYAQEFEYWYARKFDLAEDLLDAPRLWLEFEGVDYSCEVWLNGKYLGAHRGMYSPFRFDITAIADPGQRRDGANILMVKLDPPPRNYQNLGGDKFCFSGDYMPGIVPAGIWRPVSVYGTGEVRLRDTRIETTLGPDGNATVQAEVTVENCGNDVATIDLTLGLSGETFDWVGEPITRTVTVDAGTTTVTLSTVLSDPVLWWPWDMGEPHLYKASVGVQHQGASSDAMEETFGVREVRMEMNPGWGADDAEYPWTFTINGQSTFLRSACWGGPPSFYYGRNSGEKYAHRLNMVREANINNLRIFGWHPPEVKEFYDLCDRLGITVWTNFSFATQAFQATPEHLERWEHETRALVRRIRNHPSTIMWMGGEEVFFSEAHVASDNHQIMEFIGSVVVEETSTPYAPASPLSGPYGIELGFKPHESTHANEHYYSSGLELMEDYYPNLDFCIVPELTAASAPNVESLRRFIPADELWPPGPSWGAHGADLSILRMLNLEVSGSVGDDSLEQFVEATQFSHGVIAQFALESLRRKKPRVSGVSLCHFLTYLPDMKWGIVDYYGKKKSCFDYVARAYEPLLASVEVSKRRWRSDEDLTANVWLVNDHHHHYSDLSVKWWVEGSDGAVTGSGTLPWSAESNSSAVIGTINAAVPGGDGEMFRIHVEVVDGHGATLSHNWIWLLVGDQDQARAHLLGEYQKSLQQRIEAGQSYYNDFPELKNLD